MNVKELSLTGFMSHATTSVAFPERGVVLVTGPNGAGKSAIVEGVATAFWGETLRGARPWRDGEAGEVIALSDTHRAHRAWTGAKGKLSWVRTDATDGMEFSTVTAAQAALEREVGTFDVWRRTCVFSSQDAATFTQSTDGERKRLLERMLGIERFDDALDACRRDLHLAERAGDQARADKGRAEAALASERKRRDDAVAALALSPAAKAVDAEAAMQKVEELRRMATACRREAEALQGDARSKNGAAANARAKLDELKRRLCALEVGECPTCGQPMPEARRAAARSAVVDCEAKAEAAGAEADAAEEAVNSQARELSDEYNVLMDRVHRTEANFRAAAAMTEQHARLTASSEEAGREIARLEAEVERAGVAARQADELLGVLGAVERVLGLKGVRACVLARALGGIEAAANAWLARIAGEGLSLCLRPYVEKKSGGVSDAIGLDVLGAGGGRGYRGASGGERRRIDVALLLALSDVSQAAHGRAAGTMFFDEVFDALDGEGVERVASALRELAQDRAVVIITHNEELAEKLPQAARWRLAGGTICL